MRGVCIQGREGFACAASSFIFVFLRNSDAKPDKRHIHGRKFVMTHLEGPCACPCALRVSIDEIRCVLHLPLTLIITHLCAASVLAGSC